MLVKTIFAAIATASFGILFNIRGANLILAGVNGGIGYLVFTVSVASGFETYIGMFYASLLMTAIAEILARYRKAPASIFLAAALIPIVPGGRLFNVVMNCWWRLSTGWCRWSHSFCSRLVLLPSVSSPLLP